MFFESFLGRVQEMFAELIGHQDLSQNSNHTLPETNSLPLKIDSSRKRRFLLETIIFRGENVSFRERIPYTITTAWSGTAGCRFPSTCNGRFWPENLTKKTSSIAHIRCMKKHDGLCPFSLSVYIYIYIYIYTYIYVYIDVLHRFHQILSGFYGCDLHH